MDGTATKKFIQTYCVHISNCRIDFEEVRRKRGGWVVTEFRRDACSFLEEDESTFWEGAGADMFRTFRYLGWACLPDILSDEVTVCCWMCCLDLGQCGRFCTLRMLLDVWISAWVYECRTVVFTLGTASGFCLYSVFRSNFSCVCLIFFV